MTPQVNKDLDAGGNAYRSSRVGNSHVAYVRGHISYLVAIDGLLPRSSQLHRVFLHRRASFIPWA